MSKRQRRSGGKRVDKYAKQKIVAIPILLIVLGYVVVDGMTGSDESEYTPILNVATTPAHNENVEVKSDEKKLVTVWPSPNLSLLDLKSPFTDHLIKENHQGASATSTDSASVGLRNDIGPLGVLDTNEIPYVFESGSTKKALVNGRLVQPGETLVDGVQLYDIKKGKMILKTTGSTGQID